MTQEDKELLLKDLCARLSYHNLQVQYDNKDWSAIGYGHERIELLPNPFSSIAGPCPLIEDVKPYLRPMSSMTEKEREDFEDWSHGWFYVNENGEIFPMGRFTDCGEFEDGILVGIDYLIKNHFDYRGLIEKGLALEAPKGMYNLDKK